MTRHEDRKRIGSGIDGLDTLLFGGLLRGSTHLVVGNSGTGKTVMANQICFHAARQGARSVYVSLLVESHGRMVDGMRSLGFFDERSLAEALFYVDGYHALAKDGPNGFSALVRQLVRERRPGILVFDCLDTIKSMVGGAIPFRALLHDVASLATVAGCTTIFLGHGAGERVDEAQPASDIIIELSHERVGKRTARQLEVRKSRGSLSLDGQHSFVITSEGLQVFPRTEALFAAAPIPTIGEAAARVELGLPELDRMLGGGLPSATNTVLVGGSGAGKTLLAMQFLCHGAALGQPGLYFGFYEWPRRVLESAERIGLPARRLVDAGALELLWRPSYEQLIDDVVAQLLGAVQRRDVQRLVIDGISGLRAASLQPERLMPILSALATELRRMGVTVLMTDETPDIRSSKVELSAGGLSILTENIVYLDALPTPEAQRFVAILKMRTGPFDRRMRSMTIANDGIKLGEIIDASATMIGEPWHSS